MGSLGVISGMVYGGWAGKTGDHVTRSLNLLMVAASLTLLSVSYRRSKRGFAGGSVLALWAVGFLVFPPFVVGPADVPPGRDRLPIRHPWRDAIARTMDADEYMHLLSWVCFLSAIASILVLIVSPGHAAHGGDLRRGIPHEECPGTGHGDWSAGHPARDQARATRVSGQALLCRSCSWEWRTRPSRRLHCWPRCYFCGISGFDSLWRKGRAARMTGTILAVFFAPILIVAVIAPDTFLEMIGKDPTLTGRTHVSRGADVIQDIGRSRFADGAITFFGNRAIRYATEISDAVRWTVITAHNGLLEFRPTSGCSAQRSLPSFSLGPSSWPFGASLQLEAACDFNDLVLCRDTVDRRK